jgi:hypothetical protein
LAIIATKKATKKAIKKAINKERVAWGEVCFMELRLLRYFLAVAREESITGATEVLHVTQPTLSRQLSELERSWGLSFWYGGSARSP